MGDSLLPRTREEKLCRPKGLHAFRKNHLTIKLPRIYAKDTCSKTLRSLSNFKKGHGLAIRKGKGYVAGVAFNN
eukprot:36872-Pelagomonas_calceolata.AAC.1